MTLVSALTIGVLYGVGTYLLLQRTLTRIILGLALLGHGANVLLVTTSGRHGEPPLIGDSPLVPGVAADPLPQALALTAIVITFGVVAFLLAMAYRSWQLSGGDEVEDDVEDRRVASQLSARRAVQAASGASGRGARDDEESGDDDSPGPDLLGEGGR